MLSVVSAGKGRQRRVARAATNVAKSATRASRPSPEPPGSAPNVMRDGLGRDEYDADSPVRVPAAAREVQLAGRSVWLVIDAKREVEAAERRLRRAVGAAREHGVTWDVLASIFGVTRQAVAKRFGGG